MYRKPVVKGYTNAYRMTTSFTAVSTLSTQTIVPTHHQNIIKNPGTTIETIARSVEALKVEATAVKVPPPGLPPLVLLLLPLPLLPPILLVADAISFSQVLLEELPIEA